MRTDLVIFPDGERAEREEEEEGHGDGKEGGDHLAGVDVLSTLPAIKPAGGNVQWLASTVIKLD